MKIPLISLSTPTFNNVGAASALPYHLIKGCKGKHDFSVYSFNINNIPDSQRHIIEQELGIKIKIIPQPLWVRWMFRLHLQILRFILKYPYLSYFDISLPIEKEIRGEMPDKIWIYGEELGHVARRFNDIPCIMLMPDCESMYYHRLLAKRFATQNLLQIIRYALAYYTYRSMEFDFCQRHVTYYFVGDEDARFYSDINPEAKVVFIRHPLYEYTERKEIRFSHPKLKILVTGRYDIYMKEACDDAFDAMIKEKDLREHYQISFLGKGWERWCNTLQNYGFIAHHITFAPDYIEELVKHDIQLTPISVGTGTKGKVLDALANALLVIGTHGALENIAVENHVSCIEYSKADELIAVLKDIPKRRPFYKKVAEQGTSVVRELHDREKIARIMFKE